MPVRIGRVEVARSVCKQSGPDARVLRARDLRGLDVDECERAIAHDAAHTDLEAFAALSLHRLHRVTPQLGNDAGRAHHAAGSSLISSPDVPTGIGFRHEKNQTSPTAM